MQSVFCVDRLKGVRPGRCFKGVRPGPYKEVPNEQSFDVAKIEFQEDGSLAEASQLKTAADTIKAARDADRNGALVVLFIHGWHHNAQWDVTKYASHWDADAKDWNADVKDDPHFRQFRRVLMGLSVREAERYLPSGESGGRRVVGIYLGWNGDPTSWFGSWLSGTQYSTHLSFYNRYRAAEKVGGGSAIREAIRTIVEITKTPKPNRPEVPACPGGSLDGSAGAGGGLPCPATRGGRSLG